MTRETKDRRDLGLGDIMGRNTTGLLLPSYFSPLQRILLSANGNVQRILSSYHNQPVKVDIVYNKITTTTVQQLGKDNENIGKQEGSYDRLVHLILGTGERGEGRCLCIAKSRIVINSSKYLTMIQQEGYGIGQLFR